MLTAKLDSGEEISYRSGSGWQPSNLLNIRRLETTNSDPEYANNYGRFGYFLTASSGIGLYSNACLPLEGPKPANSIIPMRRKSGETEIEIENSPQAICQCVHLSDSVTRLAPFRGDDSGDLDTAPRECLRPMPR